MSVQKKSQKISSVYSITVLLFIFVSFLKAENIIINKTVISKSSVIGNSSVVINSKETKPQKALKKGDLKKVKKEISCKLDKISVSLPDFKLYIKNDKKCLIKLPLFLSKKMILDNDFIKIADNRDIPLKIEIYSKYFEKLELNGNYSLILDKALPKTEIESTGEGVIEITSKTDKIYLNLVGDFKINIDKNVDFLSIDYTGDIDLTMQKASRLNIKGTGDIKISLIDTPAKFQKDVVGDIKIDKRK